MRFLVDYRNSTEWFMRRVWSSRLADAIRTVDMVAGETFSLAYRLVTRWGDSRLRLVQPPSAVGEHRSLVDNIGELRLPIVFVPKAEDLQATGYDPEKAIFWSCRPS